MDVRTKFCRLVGSTLLFSAFVFQNLAAADDSVDPVGAPQATNPGSLGLLATATLTADQITQPEVIFLYSFALPPGQPSFLGLKGAVSLTSDMPVFNESLNTVATNISGPCPADGSVYPNYAAIYAAYPNLFPLQSFILKSPNGGVSKVAIDYTLPVGLPVANCIVVMLDWEGNSMVTMTSALKMSYTTAPPLPSGQLLSTNQEFVFGIYIGPGSTGNDALSLAEETKITQPGKLVAFVGDISDSTFGISPPPGEWRTTNDIYLVPSGCPSDIHVNSGGWTPNAGHYYSDIPPGARHLLNVPLSGFQAMAAQRFVYKALDVKVESGDCLLTLFGLKAPNGGGIDSENQIQTLFLPTP